MIKKITFLFIIFYIFLNTSKLSAESYIENIYSGCVVFNKYNKVSDKGSFNEIDYLKMMMCKSYILGWISAGRTENMRQPKNLTKSSVGCYSRNKINDIGTRAKVVSRMFVQFLDTNPKYFEKTMEVIMWDLHNKNFRC